MSEESPVPVITASEIAQHAFCARNWWLGRAKGYPSTHVHEMAVGQASHLAHGGVVARHHRLQRLAHALLFLAVLFGILGAYLLARGL